MWNFADDYGVGSCNPRELLGFAFPNDRNITESDLERLLQDVGVAYGVTYYTVTGRPYYCIPSWGTHQKVPHPSKARNPGPELAEKWLYQRQHDISSDGQDTLMRVSVDPPQITVSLSDKYKEKEKEKVKDPPPSSVGQRPERQQRGTRLPEDWQPPDEVKQRLAERYPNTRLDLILAEFVNYWTSLPGARARKLDWTKTFINRVNERAGAPQFQINPTRLAYNDRAPSGTEVAYAKLTALAAKYSQEDDCVELPAGRVQGDDEGQGILAVGEH